MPIDYAEHCENSDLLKQSSMDRLSFALRVSKKKDVWSIAGDISTDGVVRARQGASE